jgi:hypothetical protein
LLLRSASLCPAFRHLLPQAVGLDQYILRISKLLLPLLTKPAKVRPVSFFALREPPDQFEVDVGAALLHLYAEGLPRLRPQMELSQQLQVAQHMFIEPISKRTNGRSKNSKVNHTICSDRGLYLIG